MRISKQLLGHTKSLKENILVKNKQTGNHSREKENIFTKKDQLEILELKINTTEINSLIR